MPQPEVIRLIRASDLDDLVAGIRTLDRAAGADDRFFRWRLRQFIAVQQQLRERRDRLAAAARD